ncbi:MAG: alpha/beta hydrolase [Bacteroidetes bacterium]|nr:alpha/beta hydrolase [Bacteroidota bacterium]
MKRLIPLILLFACTHMLSAQDSVLLYPRSVPNSKPSAIVEQRETDAQGRIRIGHVTNPRLYVFLPPKEKANGTAVVICPGGGYARLAASHEGLDVAKQLNEWGVAAFVLIYRLPDDSIMDDKEIGPLQDAQRALAIVRDRAKEWDVNPNKVGIMGFSAGGHLASTTGTHFNHPVIENRKHMNLRPDFMILLYPVISFSDSLMHKGSRDNLIGKTPAPEKIAYYSNELQITPETPPTFLVHAKDDRTVKVQNSVIFYDALLKNKVPAEIHLFEKGGHGFGMNNPTTTDKWTDWLKVWMQVNGWLKK